MGMIGRIRRLHVRDKLSEREIARMTGLSLNTVSKWLRAPINESPKYRREPRPNKLSAFESTLSQALTADARRPKHERRTATRCTLRSRPRATAAVTRRHRLRSGLAPGRGAIGQRHGLRSLGLRAGRGLPVRLERGRSGRRWHLLSGAGCAPKVVREPRLLAGRLPEPGPRDAVRCPHQIVRCAALRWAAWRVAESTTTCAPPSTRSTRERGAPSTRASR